MNRALLSLGTVAALLVLAAAPAPAPAGIGVVRYDIPAKHDTEPVVLTGRNLGGWSVPANVTARLPLEDITECHPPLDPSNPGNPLDNGLAALTGIADTSGCAHSHYATPELDTSTYTGDALAGPQVDRLIGYRWSREAGRFLQIPLQVDERFTRYLNNEASGFSIYSGEDQHTTYAFDREGFRYTKDGPADDPCRAQPDAPTATDPVKGLDDNDEVVFMASDAGPLAPAGAPRPAGVTAAKQITLVDPTNRARRSYVYVMLAGAAGPRPAFDAANGYVQYQRDANAGQFAFSESSYDNYGAAAAGLYCDPATGQVVRNADGTPKIGQRRPLDGTTVTTRRYRFRYDGRWLMTSIRISPDGGATYGPDLVDRWKARAFTQDPSSETPCCGYEEEDTNWGGSSILLGERTGPVRAIRETWGADSGTNVIRRETFYRSEMRQTTYLRVHVIPPLDGIYAQWDFNAGRVDRFYNTKTPARGVAIDGHNDEVFGNFDDPCNANYDANDTSAFDQRYRQLYREISLCDPRFADQFHASVDPSDPTFSAANASLEWGVTSGPYGSIVDRISAEPTELSPGGAAQSIAAVPYYRDDSCFDDGTGSDPGPRVHLRSSNEPRVTAAGVPRRCWDGRKDGVPDGSDSFFQGDIGTHGLHLLFLADSDNARLTVPVTEIVSDWRMVMLPGRRGAATGEQYGRGFEKPLVPVVRRAALPGLP